MESTATHSAQEASSQTVSHLSQETVLGERSLSELLHQLQRADRWA